MGSWKNIEGVVEFEDGEIYDGLNNDELYDRLFLLVKSAGCDVFEEDDETSFEGSLYINFFSSGCYQAPSHYDPSHYDDGYFDDERTLDCIYLEVKKDGKPFSIKLDDKLAEEVFKATYKLVEAVDIEDLAWDY